MRYPSFGAAVAALLLSGRLSFSELLPWAIVLANTYGKKITAIRVYKIFVLEAQVDMSGDDYQAAVIHGLSLASRNCADIPSPSIKHGQHLMSG